MICQVNWYSKVIAIKPVVQWHFRSVAYIWAGAATNQNDADIGNTDQDTDWCHSPYLLEEVGTCRPIWKGELEAGDLPSKTTTCHSCAARSRHRIKAVLRNIFCLIPVKLGIKSRNRNSPTATQSAATRNYRRAKPVPQGSKAAHR